MTREQDEALKSFVNEMKERVIPAVVRTLDERRKAAIRQAIDDAYTPSGVKGSYTELLEAIDDLEHQNASQRERLQQLEQYVQAKGGSNMATVTPHIHSLEPAPLLTGRFWAGFILGALFGMIIGLFLAGYMADAQEGLMCCGQFDVPLNAQIEMENHYNNALQPWHPIPGGPLYPRYGKDPC